VNYAGEISFFVPADHGKYELIDSLCNCLQTQELQIKQVEKGLIRRDLWQDALNIKCQFLRHQLKYDQVLRDEIINYFDLRYEHQNVKTHYLDVLLGALEGDIRAKCFILWKSSRDKELEIKQAILEFTETSPVSKIKYSKKCSLSIEEPEILEISDKEYENPFQNSEMAVETIKR